MVKAAHLLVVEDFEGCHWQLDRGYRHLEAVCDQRRTIKHSTEA